MDPKAFWNEIKFMVSQFPVEVVALFAVIFLMGVAV